MNSIIFYINENDDVVKCEYIEKINGYRYDLITLPKKELHSFFRSSLEKYGEPKENENNGISILTFSDVDVYEIDQIIKRSNEYKKEVYNNKNDNNKPKKIVRKNKFKRVFVSTSAAVFTIIAIKTTMDKPNLESNYIDVPLENDYSFDMIMEEDNKNKLPDEIVFDNNLNDDGNQVVDDDNAFSTNEKNEENKDNISFTEVTPIYDDDTKNNQTDTLEIEDIQEIIPDITFSLDADDWVDTDKYFVANAYYSEAITKIARTYGVDPALALAIASHERGLHSEYVDAGGAIGLFQIQVEGAWSWNGKQITAYNFETGNYETVTITTDSVSDVFENIKVGCMMIQDLLIRNDYNVLKAVTEYNYGSENLSYVLKQCSYNTGFGIDELNDMNNMEWLNYRNYIHGGDPNYLENVFKYIPNGTILTFTKPNGEEIHMLYNNSRALHHSV